MAVKFKIPNGVNEETSVFIRDVLKVEKTDKMTPKKRSKMTT